MAGDGDLSVSMTLDDAPYQAGLTRALGSARKFAGDAASSAVGLGAQFEKAGLRAALSFAGIRGVFQAFRRAANESEEATALIGVAWHEVGKRIDDAVTSVVNFFSRAKSSSADVVNALEVEKAAESYSKVYDAVYKLQNAAKGRLSGKGILEGLGVSDDKIAAFKKALDQIGEDSRAKLTLAQLNGVLSVTGDGAKVAAEALKVMNAETKQAEAKAQAAAEADRKHAAALHEKTREIGEFLAASGDLNKLADLSQKVDPAGTGSTFASMRAELEKYGASIDEINSAMAGSAEEARTDFLEALGTEYAAKLGLSEYATRKLHAALTELGREHKRVADQARKESFQGFENGFADAAKEMKDLTRVGANVAQGIQSSFDTFLFDVFRNRVFDAKKLLLSLGDTFLHAITGLLGGQITGGIGSLFNFQPTPHASGGDVNPGQTYIVGEKGPELFRSSRGGSIEPNSAMKGGGGGNVTMNVHAMDAQSFMEFFRRNKGALSGVFRELLTGDASLRGAVRSA